MNFIYNKYNKVARHILFFVVLNILAIFTLSTTIEAASVSNELGGETTFLIEGYVSLEMRELNITVYDKVTGNPISDIKIELYYENSEYPITGSSGQYITDENGNIKLEVSDNTIGDTYHVQINHNGYYPYIGEGFQLTGNMDIIIYLEPIEESEDIPLIPLEPSTPLEPEVEPEVEPEQEVLPEDGNDEVKTGDDTNLVFYIGAMLLSLFIMLWLYLRNKYDDEDDV